MANSRQPMQTHTNQEYAVCELCNFRGARRLKRNWDDRKFRIACGFHIEIRSTRSMVSSTTCSLMRYNCWPIFVQASDYATSNAVADQMRVCRRCFSLSALVNFANWWRQIHLSLIIENHSVNVLRTIIHCCVCTTYFQLIVMHGIEWILYNFCVRMRSQM